MRFVAVLVTCSILGCSESAATELVVRVVDGTRGELNVPDDIDAFEVRVATVDAAHGDQVRFRRTYVLANGVGARGARTGVTLPQMLGVVPAVDGTGTVRIDVLGLRQGVVVQRISRVARYGVGTVELPPFALTPLCFGVSCPAGTTCEIDGTCGGPGPSCGMDPRCDAGVVPTGPCGATGVLCDARCIPYDDANCGACGVACPSGERCIANRCACPAGTARCGTACVVLETDASHCGACGNACSSTTATMTCRGGSCAVTACNGGLGDCDGRGENGCETSLRSVADCGACGAGCSILHGLGDCSTGVCRISQCDFGWDDCDRSDGDGCETPLTTEPNCGGCGGTCPSGESCSSDTQCHCGSGAGCGLASYCWTGVCAPRPTAQLMIGSGGCGDEGGVHPVFLWRMDVHGRPNADATLYIQHVSCGAAPGIFNPSGLLEPVRLDAAGNYAFSAPQPVANTNCSDGTLGRWAFWAVVDGIETEHTYGNLFNSMCPAVSSCAVAISYCPPA